ncbi:MAG TPA: DNA-processing protein DprA [Bacillota bacterium]|jgi:DNA processing protein|nr:DNA-protecting protein DprA [Bacillota bacterium]HOB86096.1 DNA-processing protein DprA [Bacillota bacterium]HOP68659.1 DNA-processing protein DprA [Bacillota bacterium]HPT34218.1 DNA-processing protein DprA [Bacillota bacterium]HPZ64525.1 DNA-processing protein DprA [Bacillota bacterium]
MEELIYLNALNRISLLGPVRIAALTAHFGSAREAWEASQEELSRLAPLKGVEGKVAEERKTIDPEREWEKLMASGIRVLSISSPAYPFLLTQISRPPVLLYCRGPLEDLDNPAVALVGSRRCTVYGKELAYRIARDLASAGVTVVSGLALGIDAAAHRGALAASGKTVAVLGCGLDRCYPFENRRLMEEIMEAGLVISEFPLGAKPLPQHFPRRNRIISGLALGTVVVEATLKSGALITANYALEQNREVFAFPGSVNSPYSKGPHALIKEGARLVESAEEILEELSLEPLPAEAAAAAGAADLLPEEKALLEKVPYSPRHVDEILRDCGLPPERVGALLTSLELKGFLRQMPGKYFYRV